MIRAALWCLGLLVLTAGCDRHPAADRGHVIQLPASATPQHVTTHERPSAKPGWIVGDVDAPSAGVPCSAGTTDLGAHTGFARGTAVRIRLCAIPGLPSPSPESTAGTEFHLPGAEGDAIVNARVSRAVVALTRAARRQGIRLEAVSSYRSMRHQRGLCAANAACADGDYTFVAPPGYSNHQLGVAIDFAGTQVEGTRSCARGRASDPASPVWSFLQRAAHRFGFRQYAAESWHWDPTTTPDRC